MSYFRRELNVSDPSSYCYCDAPDRNLLRLKDTVCGVNTLVNFGYLSLFFLSLVTMAMILAYLLKFNRHTPYNFKKRIAITFCFTLYGLLGFILKCADTVFNYETKVYHFFQNQTISCFVAMGIYLTIWTKVHRQIHDKDDCSKKVMILIEWISIVGGLGYFLFSIIEPFTDTSDATLGANNILKYYTFSYLVFLLIGFIITGSVLIYNIRRASEVVYNKTRVELIMNLVLNCFFILSRALFDFFLIVEEKQITRLIQQACMRTYYGWQVVSNIRAYFNLFGEGILVVGPWIYVLFLLVTEIEVERKRKNYERGLIDLKDEQKAPTQGTISFFKGSDHSEFDFD